MEKSLRDEIATGPVSLYANANAEQAEAVLGKEYPTDPKLQFHFWKEFEAYRRYQYADAMLEERGKNLPRS